VGQGHPLPLSPSFAFPSSQTFELGLPPVLQMAGAGDAAKEYVAGSAAGVAQVVVGHPFDTVKVYFSLLFDIGFLCSALPQFLSAFLVGLVSGFQPC
jgi:hypothetical protein